MISGDHDLLKPLAKAKKIGALPNKSSSDRPYLP
jgi:hypothetical protein